jgi:NADH-quinone oxidoreductase subunit M
MLAWTIYISFAGALVLALMGRERAGAARWVALGTGLAGLLIALGGAMEFANDGFRTITRAAWVPSLGIEYHLGADGISVVLVLLTGIAAVAGILFSWNIEQRVPEYFALYLLLIGGVYGVFLSFDLFLLFVFYELAIIPKYFLIAIWGSTSREYGAMKLALYSFVGSALVLIGLVAAYAVAGANTTGLAELAAFQYSREFQLWAFPLVFVGFGVLAGLWPFHSWAPTGHVAAPTAASMLLAGVIMKLGAYGCLRVALTLFPLGMDSWGESFLGFDSWREVLSVMAAAGIVYGATVALVQRDFKYVIGFSSVSHMGFVLLGILSLNAIGITGATLQMFSHGVIAGLLFAVVGRMVYDRVHTRELSELEAMRLSRAMPFAAVIFTLASFASMGMPGFSGFISELQVITGAWRAYPTLAVMSGVGIVIGAAYNLRALQKAFFGEGAESVARIEETTDGSASQPYLGGPPCLGRITMPERIGAMLLIVASIAVGLYPNCLLRFIEPSLQSPLFEWLRKGAG